MRKAYVRICSVEKTYSIAVNYWALRRSADITSISELDVK